MLKKNVAVFMIVFLLFLLTGCWDKGELNESAIAVAMGIDQNQRNGNLDVTLQVIRPSALSSQQGGGNESPYDIVTGSGRSFVEAINKADTKLDRNLSFAHMKIIVVGERAARLGINDFIDYLLRTHEMRQSTILTVTPDQASKVLMVKHGIDNVQATYMEGIVRTQRSKLNVTSTDTLHFINKMYDEGQNPVTGVLTIHNERDISTENEPQWKPGLLLSGTAVFREDKLVGYLNSRQTRGLNYISNAKKGGYILVPSLKDKNNQITIDLSKVKSQIIPYESNGKITFRIHVKVEGNIAEVSDTTDVSNLTTLKKINREFKKSVNKDIYSVVNKSQNGPKTDIFGMGRTYEIKFPSRWKKIKKHWQDHYQQVSFETRVETKINQTGLQIKPLGTK